MPTSLLFRRGQWFFVVAIALTAVVLWAPLSSAQESTPEASISPAPTPTPTPTPIPAPARPSGALVFGTGTTTLGEGFPVEYRGDRIFVVIHARTLADRSIGGIFTLTHHKPNGDLFAEVRGEISCLTVEGDHARVTGVITDARTPGLPEGELYEGVTVGIVVRDGGADRDRIAWTFGDVAPDCNELPIVTTADVEHGNFVVRD